MKLHHPNKLTLAVCLASLLILSCKKPGLYIPDYSNASGLVIGREVCKINDADDYWLIDLSYYPNTPQYGDSLALNGTIYTHVIKTRGLDQRLKQIGVKVSLDFKTVTPDKVETIGCTVTNPITYRLKELFIIHQFEVR